MLTYMLVSAAVLGIAGFIVLSVEVFSIWRQHEL